jgi:iron(III) transport system permease protein
MLRRIDTSFWWWVVGLVAVCLLPWNMLQDGFGADNALALFATDADSASALGQALFHRRWWFWPVLAAQAIAVASFVPLLGKRTRGRLLLAGGSLGIAAIAAQGWFIGVHGWR